MDAIFSARDAVRQVAMAICFMKSMELYQSDSGNLTWGKYRVSLFWPEELNKNIFCELISRCIIAVIYKYHPPSFSADVYRGFEPKRIK